MNHNITNAAAISILNPIDTNYKTGGGDVTIGGGLFIATKGQPFKPYEIYGGTTTRKEAFGNILPKKAYGMEGLRHLEDAIRECSYVNGVRVVDSLNYRYPSMSFLLTNDLGTEWLANQEYRTGDIVTLASEGTKKWICAYDNIGEVSNAPGIEGSDWFEFTCIEMPSTHRHDESIMVGDDVFMTIYPIDGDESKNRSIHIMDIDSEKKRFTIAFTDTDANGELYELERHTVGVDEDDTDDMGLSAYIELVFERASKRFSVDYREGVTWEDIATSLESMLDKTVEPKSFRFVGGTSGGIPSTEDWFKGVDLFRKETLAVNFLFAADIDIPDVLVRFAEVADDKRCGFFYDIPAHLRFEQAMEWNKSMGMKNRHARAYHSPFAANDPWRGGKTVWGVSGAMAASKARACKNISKNVPGVHYSLAGEKRGYLDRTGVKPLFLDDILNRDKFYDSRINPIIAMKSGGACADDDMVQHFETNYLRFGWINDVLDYIDHRFYEGASMVKFEPDGLTRTGLYDITKGILDDLVTSGALVAPRDPISDGQNPYIITIEQREIDLWYVRWDVCIVGAARRIAGQPALIK